MNTEQKKSFLLNLCLCSGLARQAGRNAEYIAKHKLTEAGLSFETNSVGHQYLLNSIEAAFDKEFQESYKLMEPVSFLHSCRELGGKFYEAKVRYDEGLITLREIVYFVLTNLAEEMESQGIDTGLVRQ